MRVRAKDNAKRLFSQAMSVIMEVVQQQRDRDLLQLGELEDAKRLADNTKATASLVAQKAVEAKVFKPRAFGYRFRFWRFPQVSRPWRG